jgi:hypothetical protein
MIVLGLKLLSFTARSPWMVGIVIAAILAGAGWHIAVERTERLSEIANAVQAEKMAWMRAAEIERARQAEVSAQSLAEARKEVARLEQENLSLVAAGKEWDRAAEAEADAGEWCLSPDSILRLNKAR